MGENSGIQWTHHTFNPWEGCQRVSPGCVHCYAETRNRRFAGDDATKVLWGPSAPRRRTSVANWRKPLAWDRAAKKAGVRHRVFCASLADVFEVRGKDQPAPLDDWRLELLDLIRQTPSLDWLLLTKRPESIRAGLLRAHGAFEHVPDVSMATVDMVEAWLDVTPPPNVWLGTTVEDQQRADERIPALLQVPAVVRFLSCEPLLERVTLTPWLLSEHGRRYIGAAPGISWVIIGGESGRGARPFALEWARALVRQCRAAGVAPFVKQLGKRPRDRRSVDGEWFSSELALLDAAGGDMAEWPEDLRIREFPEARR